MCVVCLPSLIDWLVNPLKDCILTHNSFNPKLLLMCYWCVSLNLSHCLMCSLTLYSWPELAKENWLQSVHFHCVFSIFENNVQMIFLSGYCLS